MKIFVIAGLFLCSSAVLAQSTTAQLTGAVTDSTGAVIPGVEVMVVNLGTNLQRKVETNDLGYYTAALLPPGSYRITVRKDGFRPVSRAGVELNVDQTAKIDFTLEVGGVAEAVEITASAPLLEASSSSLGQVIGSKQFLDLPLNNRSALGLISLSDGVTTSSGYSPDSYSGANRFSANGSRPGQNEMLLDGAPNTLPGVWPGRGILGSLIVVDAVQEFKVQTSAFSAEFGRTGGGLINMISRSGTNEWHGSLFEFLRNSKLDANDFYNNRSGIPLGSFKRNQFGGTLGAPLRLPKIYNGRNRTFFFTNYQGTRARTQQNSVLTVPTAAMRGGDFSSLATARGERIVIYDPLTTQSGATPLRQPFAGNRIPAERINPVSAKAAGYFPLPNQAGTLNNLVQSGASGLTSDLYGLRLDHALRQNQQIFARYNYTRYLDLNPDWHRNIARGFIGENSGVNSLAADYVNTLSPSLLLSLRYGYTERTSVRRDPSFGMDLTTLGFPRNVNEAAQARLFPSFAPSGYMGLGNAQGVNEFSYKTHSMQESLTKISGAHNLKFGADVRLARVSHLRGIDPSGTYSFNRGFTQGPNANQGGPTAGDAFASLLLGTPSSGAFGTAIRAESVNEYYGLYVQDDWKLTSRLTFNLGLRYELEMPRKESKDRLDWFDFNVASPLAGKVSGVGDLRGGIQFAGVGGNPRRHFDTDANNFGPRFGFAYQVDRATVARGGYGIFYGSGSIGAGGFNIASQGFAPSTTFVGSLDGLRPIAWLSDPFPNGFAGAVGSSQGLMSLVGQSVARIYDRNAPAPYNQQWNFSLQRQVASVLIQAAYSGSRGIHLTDGAGFDINQLRPETLALGSALQELVANPFYGLITNPGSLVGPRVSRGQLLRPYPHFDSLTVFNPAAAASTYHAFMVKVERRFAHGLGFLASYTTSKNLTDGPATQGPAGGHQNFYNRRADRSLVEEDIAQHFVTSGTWELPFGRSKRLGAGWNRLADGVLGGWQINAIASMQSGMPLLISNSPNTARAMGGSQRPNSKGLSARKSGRIQDRLGAFLDSGAFTAPAPFTYGNVSRTLPDVRGPRTSNLDLSLFKTFSLTESARLQFRAEWFNATNTPIFGQPNTSFGAVNFGIINSQSNNPRQIQLALRMYF